MPAGGFTTSTIGSDFKAKIMPIVIISCIMAATGGLVFGYDVGISGGVTSLSNFLKEFFPTVYKKIYEPGLVGTTNLAMLIIGRLLLGCDVSFANQAVPVFLSEIAPTRIRGALNILFQLNATIGILFADIINYFTAQIKGGWGWRLSLALAGVPALLLSVGALPVVETPNSLIERGSLDEGKRVLKKIRGIDNVEPKFNELVQASEMAKEVKHPFRNLLMRKNRPPLVIAILLQVFQQLTGIKAIMFYALVLFNTLGFASNASLYSVMIT
ncbi:Sugar transport protein [Quillaja saponaria]|uniref:Sugar transport protein n=1 Tax=Quillaja saponaria TaxID=32244 RepID=A0AAD7KWY9_QUISA|nr:Sugar transport protein [Quillaja saponaria]